MNGRDPFPSKSTLENRSMLRVAMLALVVAVISLFAWHPWGTRVAASASPRSAIGSAARPAIQ